MRVFTVLLLLLLLPGFGCAARFVPDPGAGLPQVDNSDNLARLFLALAELNEASGRWGRDCLPDHLQGRLHDDWPKPLDKVPRWVNAYCGDGPDWPEGLDAERRKPIPPRGTETWHHRDRNGSWRPYYAFTLRSGLHFRVGYRWDDVDSYYNFIPPWLATLKFVQLDPDGGERFLSNEELLQAEALAGALRP